MALITFGDFVGYDLSQYNRYWATVIAVSHTASGGRFDKPYMSLEGSGASRYIRSPSFSSISSGVIGCSCYFTDTSAFGSSILHLYEGATEHLRLSFTDSTNYITITRAGTVLTGGQSANTFARNAWHWVELKFSIADSIGANAVQLWVNGNLEATVATGQDTRNGGTGVVNAFMLGRVPSVGNIQAVRYTDYYLDDGSTPLGDCVVENLFPIGVGATQQWTPLSGDHHTNVDESVSDDDTSYVESDTVDDIELFDVQNLSSTPITIHAVAVQDVTRKLDAGPKTYASILRQGGTNYQQATIYPSTSYLANTQVLNTDPDIPGAWDIDGVNSAQIGLKVVS
jgi:hypothetical protein